MVLSRKSKENKRRLGTITSVHGIRGELRLSSLYPEIVKFQQVWLNDVVYQVERIRIHQKTLLLKLTGIDTRNDAEACRGKTVYISTKDFPDFLFYEDIIGKTVLDRGKKIGKVIDTLNSPAHNILVVQGKKEILIPWVSKFVLEIGKNILVDLTDLEEY